jgi:TetR/AcrR family transcriptional regulator, transcriptional repressor for nem operon
MSDIKTAIMNAAQRRIQLGGFGGFSFRDIAADVGIKSSSVHYHFPTKDDLAAAVIRRWADNASLHIDEALEKDPNPARVWTKVFGGTAHSDSHMCPCTVLGAAAQDLPEQVGREVKRFFTMCEEKMVSQGMSKLEASRLLSTLIGALVVANAIGDSTEYERATADVMKAA